MKATPLLFKAEMIQALLKEIDNPGTGKTMTRRSSKLETINLESSSNLFKGFVSLGDSIELHAVFVNKFADVKSVIKCPYGRPGDLIWCRETWKYWDWTEDGLPFIKYASGDSVSRAIYYPEEWVDRLTDIWSELSNDENFSIHGAARDNKWRPSIFMPRWASRITLLIEDVRVERLQDISEEDAIAEGIEMADFPGTPSYVDYINHGCAYCDPRKSFASLWTSINGIDSWARNDWVFVYSFKPILANVDAVLADPGRYGIGNETPMRQ